MKRACNKAAEIQAGQHQPSLGYTPLKRFNMRREKESQDKIMFLSGEMKGGGVCIGERFLISSGRSDKTL
jgi:hypothetical protein